jgi:hypothetical protein
MEQDPGAFQGQNQSGGYGGQLTGGPPRGDFNYYRLEIP